MFANQVTEGGPLVVAQSRSGAGGWAAVSLLGLVSLIWGAVFPLTNIAVHGGLSPTTVATVRLVLAALVLICVSAFMRGAFAFLTPANIRRLLPIGVLLLAVPHALVTWSQYFISSSQAVILMATVPLLTAFFAGFSTSRTGGAPQQEETGFASTAVRLLPGFLGICLLVGSSAWHSDRGEVIGSIVALVASASCAKAILMLSRLPAMPAGHVGTVLCTIAALAMLPVFLTAAPPLTVLPSLEALAALVFLGLVCTGLSSMLHAKLTMTAGAIFSSLGFYLSPIAGLALSALLVGERIGAMYFAAITLVLFSVYLVSPSAGIRFLNRARNMLRASKGGKISDGRWLQQMAKPQPRRSPGDRGSQAASSHS